MRTRVTLRDVAQHAGVSITTVSNVVRGWPYIAEETRTRVQDAIAALGYHPHPIAQGLRTGQMQTIGFIVPDLSSPYFASIVSVAEDIAREHGYSVIIFSSHEDELRETEAINRATNRLVDGLLIAPIAQHQAAAFQLDTNISVPVVVVDRVPEGYEGASCALDNFRVGQLATSHLIDHGHRRIAHIAGPIAASTAHDRLDGYTSTVDTSQLDYQRVVYAGTAWGCEEGYICMQELLNDDIIPTAVFASNDRVAIGALRAITESGLDTPNDVSLIGVDDIEISAYSNPPLTTIRQPIREMAQQGIELLLSMIREDNAVSLLHTLQPVLVARQSVTSPA